MPPTKTTVEINGFVVRELRMREGWSVVELAKRVDVQRPYIAKIELGHSPRVSPKVFNALVSVFSLQDRRVLLANPHGTADLEVLAESA
jgi:transcriptional regulator with XRE-family HTH domain